MTLAELHAKIEANLKEPMEEIHRRMMANEATAADWRTWTEYRRNQLLYPTSAEQNMSGD